MPYNSGECELCGQYRSIRSSNGLCATCKAGSRNSSITDTVREIRNKEHHEWTEGDVEELAEFVKSHAAGKVGGWMAVARAALAWFDGKRGE